jgi:hypothetical protein
MSFVFVSDGSFQEKIKSEVLSKAGERAANQIMEDQSYDPPFSLQRKSQIQMGKTNILEVLNKFTKQLKKEEENYKKVWDSHIKA